MFSVSMTGWAVEQGDVVGSGRVIEGNATDAGTSGLTPSCICRTESLCEKTEASKEIPWFGGAIAMKAETDR